VNYLFGDSTGNDKADRILEHLTDKHPEAVAKTMLYGLFGRNIAKAELDIALKLLHERELIEIGTPKTGTKGRPKEYIQATEAAVQRRFTS
jgi:hypothetical protein